MWAASNRAYHSLDFSTTGDGLLAALQVLAEVKRAGKPVSEVCKMFEPVPQVLKNVKFKSGKPLDDVQVKTAIAEATSRLGTAGRLVHPPIGHGAAYPRDGGRRRRTAGECSCRRALRRPFPRPPPDRNITKKFMVGSPSTDVSNCNN